jgi:hypothetical protein
VTELGALSSRAMDLGPQGRVVLVTGSNRGIGRVTWFTVDVTDPEQVGALPTAVVLRLGRVDGAQFEGLQR